MKAITLREPWAWAIGRVKGYETRSWSAPGDLIGQEIAIHADVRKVDPWDWRRLERVVTYFAPGILFPAVGKFPLGSVVSIARLTECVEMTLDLTERQSPLEREWGGGEVGRYAWRLEDVRFLRAPIPARGGQGVWDWAPPGDLEERLEADGG